MADFDGKVILVTRHRAEQGGTVLDRMEAADGEGLFLMMDATVHTAT